MMITQRYTYAACPRETINGSRHYLTPDGRALPSVTTILGATQPQEKREVLANWRKSVGEERAQQITTEAASRGTRMHTYLEKFVLTGELPDRGSNPFSWASHAMASVVIEQGLYKVDEYWGTEAALYFPGIYAGTTDLVGVHEGVPAIMDFKQSNRVKKKEWIEDYFLQLAAYSEAHNEVHGTQIQKGVVLMAVKPEVDRETHHLKSTPVYLEFIVEGDEFEFWRQQWWRRVEQYYSL